MLGSLAAIAVIAVGGYFALRAVAIDEAEGDTRDRVVAEARLVVEDPAVVRPQLHAHDRATDDLALDEVVEAPQRRPLAAHDAVVEARGLVEFELRRARAGERWRVVLVHERRVAWRATLRTRGSSGALRVRRTIEDLDGPDGVTVRAAGPRGRTCEAAATLPA